MQSRESSRTTNVTAEQRVEIADKLYRRAKKFIADGDFDAAEKSLLKAERFHSTPQAKALLRQLRNSRSNSNGNQGAGTANRQEGSKQRDGGGLSPHTSVSNARSRTSSQRSTEPDYTREQIDAVRRAIKAQNHYIILEVAPDVREEGILEAYKKFAKVLHPDKNKAPGATEAFQKLLEAKEVLSDSKKRQAYDDELLKEIMSQSVSLPSNANFDIPVSLMVIGGVAVCAGLFMWWWNSGKEEKKEDKTEKNNEEPMSQE